jgi:hypothetical protein
MYPQLELELQLIDAPPIAPRAPDPLHELSIKNRLFDRHLPFASGLPTWFLEGRWS